MVFTDEPPAVSPPGRSSPPRRSSRWLSAALLVSGVLLLMYITAPRTIGETARRHFLQRLVAAYPDHRVSISHGSFNPEVGLIFEGIKISQPSTAGLFSRSSELVRIDRLTLVSDIHPERLLDQQAPLETRKIVIDGIQLTGWFKPNGELSLQDLLPIPKFGPTVPRMELHRTNFRLLDLSGKARPVDVELSGILIQNSTTNDGTEQQVFSIEGSADFADRLMVKVHRCGETTDVAAKVIRANLTSDLLKRLPVKWTRALRPDIKLECLGDLSLALRQQPSGEFNYKVKATVHQGRVQHPDLPRPITDLWGELTCDPSGVEIASSAGVFGDASVRASGIIKGTTWPCDVDLQLSASDLMLEDRLVGSLPAGMQKAWDKIQPHGRIDVVTANVRHEGGKWDFQSIIECKAIDVKYEKFPYPVEDLRGRIEIRDGIAFSEAISGRIGESPLQCAFRNPIRPDVSVEKSFAVRINRPVTIDNAMITALTPRGQPTSKLETFIRSLRPRGTIQLESAVLRTAPDGTPHRDIVVRLVDGHVQYEKFPYPIGNISGRVEIEDDLVRLINISASNANAGAITCEGIFRMPPKSSRATDERYYQPGMRLPDQVRGQPADSQLQLHFVATDVPMDQSLRRALPESTRHTWDSISPNGLLDQLSVTVTQNGAGKPVDLDITARQHETDQVTNRTLSLRPVTLPYRLDVSGGSVRFDGKRVTIHALQGRHNASTLSADGQCIRNANGRWELALDLHSGSRLHPDAELIDAMPAQLREAMRRLQLRGAVSVRGKTRILLPDQRDPVPSIAWNLGLQLEGNRFGDVGPVHSLRGEIAVRGVQDENGPRAIGRVRIDSMHVYDYQITAIEGPFSVTGDRLQLGNQSHASSGLREGADGIALDQAQSSIEGHLFEGKIALNGNCTLSTGNFSVGLVVDQCHLPTALIDFGQPDHGVTGTFGGEAKLHGSLGNIDLLKGTGTARLTGANLYQLPLIVQVLNLLRVTPTEDVAFTDGSLQFSLDGETVDFNDLQIWGDLVTLHGGGTLDRMRELDLTFNTRVSPQNSFTQIIRPLRSQRYTLGTVDVRGPLGALEIERRALDGVGQTLERLFPAIAESDANDADDSQFSLPSWFR